MREITTQSRSNQPPLAVAPTLKYCLYARKSTEAEDKQALSIESQIKEMTALAQREKLHIVEVKPKGVSYVSEPGQSETWTTLCLP